MAEFIKERFDSQGTVDIKGTKVPYESCAENFPITGPQGEPIATMYTFSYCRSDIGDTAGRPVLFAWNGGPGCGSMFVHMGLLSPMRAKCGEGVNIPKTAPFELVNNDNCLLDTCDVISIDAIGTGYARVLDQSARKDIRSTTSDAIAFISCIRQWLTAHDRWNSPVYIMGESYGTIRNAMIAEGMFYDGAIGDICPTIHLSGVIMLGSALDYGQDMFRIPLDVLNLPSAAAANWYWRIGGEGFRQDADADAEAVRAKYGDVSLEAFVDECCEFCYDEYLRAVCLGKRLPEDEKRAVAEKVSYYTGYPAEQVLAADLRFDIFAYPVQGLAAEKKAIGIYDARLALHDIKAPKKYDFFGDDASNVTSMPVFTIGFNGIWKKQLGIEKEEEYIEMWGSAEGEWDFKTAITPMEALEKAMYRNPGLKLMFGAGYYDMLTTVGWVRYLISQYNYPEDRTFVKYYKSGHMPYLGDDVAMQLEEDIKEFIRA